MGDASAKAQGLLSSVTSGEKLLSSQHHLYILREGGSVVGILKVGSKRLFVVDSCGSLHECNALCVLDFYVQEQKQRRGHGKKLFDTMLQVEGLCPGNLAVDRPSPKLISFLQKHYGLTNAIKQANNFVVFESFFSGPKREKQGMSVPRQRHSFCGTENQDTGFQTEKASRPHSLGGLSGGMWWASGTADGRKRQNSETKDTSTSSSGSRESFGFSPKLSSHLNRSGSSSWNIFGVPPPDYLDQGGAVIDGRSSRMSS